MSVFDLLKCTLSMFARDSGLPTVAMIDRTFVFPTDTSDDVKYFFYKQQSFIYINIMKLENFTMSTYQNGAWKVYSIKNKRSIPAFLFISYGTSPIEHTSVRYLLELLSLILDSKHGEKFAIKRIESLSDREKDVFLLLLEGYSNKEIASKLMLSHHTVKNHVHNVLKKMGADRRSHLIAKFSQFYRLSGE